jgi:hypothetical protein
MHGTKENIKLIILTLAVLLFAHIVNKPTHMPFSKAMHSILIGGYSELLAWIVDLKKGWILRKNNCDELL